MRVRGLLLLLLVFGVAGAAQESHAPLRFAAVSIKVLPPGFRFARKPAGPVLPGGKYIAYQTILWSLIEFAHPGFAAPGKTVVGLPDWAFGRPGSFFQIEAVPAPGANPSLADMREMMGTVLRDRFHLKFHVDRRAMQVYFLEVARGGTRYIKPSAAGHESLLLRLGDGVIGRGATMEELAEKAGAYFLDRPVLDRTGLKGFYDIDGPAPAGGGSDSDGAGTIRRQLVVLGLRLVAGKAAVPVMVVDHVTMPTPN